MISCNWQVTSARTCTRSCYGRFMQPGPGVHVLNARAFRMELEFRKCWFLRRGENRSTRRKTSRSREENQQQTQPTYDVESGNRTRATLVEGECSHHCAIPAPQKVSFPLLPEVVNWAKDELSRFTVCYSWLKVWSICEKLQGRNQWEANIQRFSRDENRIALWVHAASGNDTQKARKGTWWQ